VKGDAWFRLLVEAVYGQDFGFILADVELPRLRDAVEVGDKLVESFR